MVLSEEESRTILGTRKTITGDVRWSVDPDHPTWVEFRVEVSTAEGFPVFVVGSYNYEIPALRYCLIHKGVGRVSGLCYGTDHHNPSCENTGEKHKHRWTDSYKDKDAYVPNDITAVITETCLVWRQFCEEANIEHNGDFAEPPPKQEEVF